MHAALRMTLSVTLAALTACRVATLDARLM